MLKDKDIAMTFAPEYFPSWKSEIFRDNVVVGFLRCIDVPQLPYLL
jgi:hypothetical protein